jgi:phosphatidylserine decarboxylase
MEYYDRQKMKLMSEDIYGQGFLWFLYATRAGRFLNAAVFTRHPFNRVFGLYWDSRLSSRRIRSFVAKYGISMDEYAVPSNGFSNFNLFFSRKFRAGIRRFIDDEATLCAPVEGKLLVLEGIDPKQTIPVKDSCLRVGEVFRSPLEEYQGGTLLIFRLYLADYHRFHFFDSGVSGPAVIIPGRYYSVTPMRFLSQVPQFYIRNQRQVTVFESDHFGTVLISEVGGFCVGSILQTYRPGFRVRRGEEKGYFAFGGSTVILLFRPGRVRMDFDILDYSRKQIETRVLLGTRIGEIAGA